MSINLQKCFVVQVFCFGQGQFEAISTASGLPDLFRFIENNIPGAQPGIEKLDRIQTTSDDGITYTIEGQVETSWNGSEELMIYMQPLDTKDTMGIYGGNLVTGRKLLETHRAAVWHNSITSLANDFTWIVIA